LQSTKERIVETSAELFRRQGYIGTGLKQILAEADAPFGSLYHFFPGGKAHLGEEVIRHSGGLYQVVVESVWDAAPDPITGVSHVFLGAAETLRATDYADACPIATVALEVASTHEGMRVATADVFSQWIDSATKRLASAGLEPDAARALGINMICALEGAFVLSRAMRSTEPLEAAGAAAVQAVRAALAVH
jgi:AcrR family transcriptional regulator